MAKTTEDDLLDAIAEEIRSDKPQAGEYTRETFRAEMKKRKTPMTSDEADGWLQRKVEEGKWTVRDGHGRMGRPCKIYKPA